MLIDVYDLLDTFSWCRFSEFSNSDVHLEKQIKFSDILIYPRHQENQPPYLQNLVQPAINDFLTVSGQWRFNNSFSIHEILYALQHKTMLQGNIPRAPGDVIKDFFAAIQELLNLPRTDDEIQNIILIPDHYDAIVQETILKQCGLPRDRTTLLWRSVAAILGAEGKLSTEGVKEEDKVAVIDVRPYEGNISILTMKKDHGKLIPQRRSFYGHKEYFPRHGREFCQKVLSPFAENSAEDIFVRHVYRRRTGLLPVPSGNRWIARKIEYEELPQQVSLGDMHDVSYAIVLAQRSILFKNQIFYQKSPKVIDDFSFPEGYTLRGAGRFAVRRKHRLPTYFDYREAFAFICIDREKEEVVPEILIEEKEDCKGGETFEGNPINDRFYVDGGNEFLDFNLLMGTDKKKPLKKLRHQLETSISRKQPLVLSPSMVVGQGFPIVRVEGQPLLQHPVILDFLKMADSTDTITSLNEKLERSFPTDIPQVQASDSLWEKVKNNIECYLSNKIPPNGTWFAKSTFPYDKEEDYIKRLQRVNVFGTDSSFRIPPSMSYQTLYSLCKKLKEDYASYSCRFEQSFGEARKRYKYLWNQVIRLISWTYQDDNICFETVKSQTLQRLINASVDSSFSLVPQEYTLYAHFANCADDYKVFFDCFFKVLRLKGYDGAITNWLRAFYNMLLLHNNMLENIASDTCIHAFECLQEIIRINCVTRSGYYSVGTKILTSLRVMLFLLRRRRYDHDFLKKDSFPWQSAKQNVEIVRFISEKINKRSLLLCCETLIKYLDGEGTLEGIPKLVEDAEKDNNLEGDND